MSIKPSKWVEFALCGLAIVALLSLVVTPAPIEIKWPVALMIIVYLRICLRQYRITHTFDIELSENQLYYRVTTEGERQALTMTFFKLVWLGGSFFQLSLRDSNQLSHHFILGPDSVSEPQLSDLRYWALHQQHWPGLSEHSKMKVR